MNTKAKLAITAITAVALGTGVDLDTIVNAQESEIIVDGRTGDIILNPTPETITRYQSLRRRLQSHYRTLEKLGSFDAETFDGFKISLSANVETVNELDVVHQYGSSGI